MSATVSSQIDPWQAVAREATYAGTFLLEALPRLRGALATVDRSNAVTDTGGETWEETPVATYDLAFRRDEARRPVVLGWVHAVVPLVCQRCLGVVEHVIDAPVCLMLVPGADAGTAPEPYDPLPVVAAQVSLADLVEDELLLALPQIPKHAPGTCAVAVGGLGLDSSETQEIAGDTDKRPNPFAALAGWKSESKN
jgi:uncharacterized protein